MAFPYNGTDAIAIGTLAGATSQSSGAIAIGKQAGSVSQGTNAIAIGSLAGGSGTQSIALGYNVQTSTFSNSIAIGASAVSAISSSAFYVNPVRNATQTVLLGYNTTDKEITYFNQNAAIIPSGIPTNATTQNATLSINFNNAFSSTTRYAVIYVAGGTTTITINNYAFSNAVAGGQYTLSIEIVIPSNPGVTYTFNGTGLPATIKTNFTTITTGSINGPATRYIILTIAYDGTNYFMSGSTFA